ncbi:RND efflux system, outer membrane lipoprotein CmeC [Croceitalea dokdonensis DOKDO 023]|uniref:RND efflux system, outer membrane lipoprotein CmeC n=1 Tax=Croceitalea dokdonensis DOKDO 023 TaxID=1300341 RepID=A0A0P7ADT2_9FLAO|nr:TolC family protein [Croceitalea dokdonensis]KPM31374.1 RND efflux system, outer membrane lipoprotein CmeC [Croceitalea dokdonensis DOKDO 023]
MKLKVTFAILFCAAFITQAQMKKWTLEECVNYAVENNLTIEQFELNLENVQIDEVDAWGNFIPNLTANTVASERSGLVTNPNTNIIEPGQIFSTSAGINSGITLFDGLRNIYQLQRAKLNAIATQYGLEDLKDDIRLNVAEAYLQVLSNKEALKVAQAQYQVTEQDLKRTKELVESGVLPRGDLLDIEATAATQEQQIVNGEAQVLIAKVNLAQLLQITDYQNFDVADESYEVPPSEIMATSPETIFAKALTFRNDIKLSEANIDIANKDLQIAKGARYPTLNAFFNYNTFYTNQFRTIPDGMGGFIPFRADFIDQLWLNDGISYGFQLNVPIFNGFSTENSIKRSKIDVKRAELQLEQTKLELENTIQQAHVNVATFGKAYEAAQKTLDARKLAYDYAKERYEAGLLNSFDFGQAQARVDNAEASVIRSKYDYIFRLKILEFFYGVPLSLE